MHSRAYRVAAGEIRAHAERITSGKQARKIRGVGAAISKKIDEILETGDLNKIHRLKAKLINEGLYSEKPLRKYKFK